ncbi:MID_MedPIWI domain-containing protein [Haematococcus lacustris]|uniref:MID_MedPIWI domain-containing protein n=1 Tax=Haematococcus lacustris TaxID=44745 RepID=A0A699Z511_HAELA|nr:MID_MedPIWI domain-containing protein [Haematococcus lacustris]
MLCSTKLEAAGVPTASSPATSETQFLMSHQGQLLQGPAELLPLWNELPLEPLAGPKPLRYTVLCPDDLAPTALLFFADLAAAYSSAGCGQQRPAPACGRLRKAGPVAPASVQVRGQAAVGALQGLGQGWKAGWAKRCRVSWRGPGPPPLDITLQLVLPSMLRDLTGRAVRATAWAVYAKQLP